MINVAIIGTGNISPAHIEAYLAHNKRCKIVALVDIYPEKAKAKNEQFKLGAEVFDSHKSILDREDIDLVSVCTPPYTHADIAIDFMNAGKNVIVEKPMAASLEECDKMIETAKKTGKLMSIIAQNRFRDPIMNLKTLLDQKVAGRVLHAEVNSFWFRGHSYYDLWWRGTWEKEGGGCTLNHAVHHIDMLNWIMGLPKEVTSVVANLNHDNAEIEDFSVTVAKYNQNALATLSSSLVHYGEEQKLVFQCENAKLSAPWDIKANKIKQNGFPEDEPNKELIDQIEKIKNDIPALKFEGHAGQFDNVLSALETGSDFLIKGIDGRNTIEFITAVYKSGYKHEKVVLPISNTDPFYTVKGIRENVTNFYEKTSSVENFEDTSITLGAKYSDEK